MDQDDHPQQAEQAPAGSISRRNFLRYGAYTGAAAAAGPSLLAATKATAQTLVDPAFQFKEATIAELQHAMETGATTSRKLTQAYIDRIDGIDQHEPRLNSVLEDNPHALAIADQRDVERQHGHVRGPLHGIPILIKDNIATADRMETTAGSFALLGSVVPRDSFMAARLRHAGAVILGKTNLSEWANFRSFQSSSGWSGRAGQCLNPYVLDHNPCGSSSGSGTAISANLAAAALGSETDGSIVCPSSTTGLVGIKPTLGLTSRAGVIPIAHSQDVVGPMARTIADAATVLGALTGVDFRDPATKKSKGHSFHDYRQFLDPNGLKGARLGVWREGGFGFSPEGDAIADEAFQQMKALGATIIDPTDIPNVDATFGPEFTVLLYEFKNDLNLYLADLISSPVRTLKQAIRFDDSHAGTEMPWFGQELFLLSQQSGPLTDPVYLKALKLSKKLAQNGINDTMDKFNLDAIVSLTGSPSWTTDLVNGDHFLTACSTPSAVAGYPHITVPAGYSFGELPVGVSFMGRQWDEPKLIKLASGFEHGPMARKVPKLIPTFATRDFVPRGPRGRSVPGTSPNGSRSASKTVRERPPGF